MSTVNRGYRLVIYASHFPDPHIFRDILADYLHLHPTDAMRLVSHAPGIIPQNLTSRRARRLGEKLASIGIHCAVWRAADLPDLRAPAIVHRVQCGPEGLKTFGVHGAMAPTA